MLPRLIYFFLLDNTGPIAMVTSRIQNWSIRVRKAYVLLAGLLVLLNLSAGNAQGIKVEDYIPKAADEAIDKSQGLVAVETPVERQNAGGGVLISADGLVATALHLVKTAAKIPDYSTITFRGVSTKVEYVIPHSADFALLKIDKIPDGMVPATLAKDVPLYTPVFAKFSGYRYVSDVPGLEGTSLYFGSLPYRALVVGIASVFFSAHGLPMPTPFSFLYLDKPMAVGFSGNMFVNAQGETVGIGSFIDSGYSGLVSVYTIQQALEDNRRQNEERRSKSQNRGK